MGAGLRGDGLAGKQVQRVAHLQQHQLALLELELVVAAGLARLRQLLGQAGDGRLVAAGGVLDLRHEGSQIDSYQHLVKLHLNIIVD
jgi:hypothetical protein